jgi:hypothetical protein
MTDPRVQEISIPYPEASELTLSMTIGAGRVTVAPGDGDTWVSGSYRDPSGKIPCVVSQDGGAVRISQGRGVADFVGLIDGVPSFDLRLGRAKVFSLTIDNGAGEATLDLGGVPISRATGRQGAGKTEIDFTSPNSQPMSLLDLSSGAGVIVARNLANANATEIAISGGAASFKLDFGGNLVREANVRISTGMSSVEITIPSSTAAKVTSHSILGNVDSGDAFSQREGALWNEAAIVVEWPIVGGGPRACPHPAIWNREQIG